MRTVRGRLLYLGYDKDGLPLHYDLSYMDPVDYWKRPIRALLNGNNVDIDTMRARRQQLAAHAFRAFEQRAIHTPSP